MPAPTPGAWLTEPFIIGPRYTPWREERPPQPKVPQRFNTEKAAREALEGYLSPYFTLVPEVRLRERGWPFQFIDYVAICPEDWPFKAFGIEVKRGYSEVKDACDVVEQAWRYRKAAVSDDRVTCVLGERLPFVFCWPELSWAREPWAPPTASDEQRTRWAELSDARAGGEARAIRLIAGRSNVGSIDIEYRWFGEQAAWQPRITLMVGQSAVWSSWGFEKMDGYFGQGAQHGLRPDRGLRAIE